MLFTNYAKEAFELKENVFVCDLVWKMRVQNKNGDWLPIEQAFPEELTESALTKGTATGPNPSLALAHTDHLKLE